MLVLSRKNGQKIIINDNIEITILDSKVDNCKIAINAPNEVKIYREEVYKQIQASNKISKEVTSEAIDSLMVFMTKNAETNPENNKVFIKKKEK
jgi:carbon storage regulator